MRPSSHALLVAALVASTVSACSAVVRPGAQPSLGSDTGIVVLIVDTDTPLYDISFVEAEEFEGFKLGFADAGRSVHLFKVPAERYRLADFDTGEEGFTAEAGGELCILVKPGQLNYPGHFVFRNAEQKKGYKTYANWEWRVDEADMKRRITVEWTDLMAAYPVETTACP